MKLLGVYYYIKIIVWVCVEFGWSCGGFGNVKMFWNYWFGG